MISNLNNINLNDPRTIAFLGATIGIGGLLAYKLTRPKPQIIHATVECHCGKVKGSITAPMESTPSAACHCNDCLTFVTWMNDVKKSPIDVRPFLSTAAS